MCMSVSDVCYRICNSVTHLLHDLARTALGISAGRSGTGVRPQCIGAIGGVPPVIAPPTVKLRTPCDFRGSPSFSLLEVINLTLIPSKALLARPRCAAVAEERPRVALVRPADRRCWASSSAAAQRQASTPPRTKWLQVQRETRPFERVNDEWPQGEL